MARQEVGQSRLAAGNSGRSTRQSGFVRRHVVEEGGTTRLLAVIAAPVRPRRVSVCSPDFEPPRPWTGTCVFISSAGASIICISGESSVFCTIYLFFVSGPRADGDKQNRVTASAVDYLCFIGPGKSEWSLLGTQESGWQAAIIFLVMAVFLVFLDQQQAGVTDDAEQLLGSGRFV